MATVTIDGKTITIDDGTLILDAARRLGIEIPTFCYQAKLSRLASCRMCLVEIEGQRKLQPSCATPVLDGMVIHTSSPAVVTARQAMLEFLLANHPLDCPICDKGGECELQDMVFTFGPRKGRFAEWKRTFHSRDYILSPVIIKNANRCVQCQRCVRICEEIVGAAALGSIGRGVKTEETSFMREWLNCDHCGNCIEVCPVGSLMSLPYRYKARPWDLKEVDTVCPYCGTGCALTVGLRDGQLLRVRSRRETGVNEETLCVKGRFGLDFVVHEERVKRPMVRKNDVLVPVSWKEASNYLKERLSSIKGNGKAIGGLISPLLTNEEIYTFQKLLRGVFKSNNIDSSSRWPVARGREFYSVVAGLIRNWYMRMPLQDLLSTDTLVVVGSNVTDENPVTDYVIRHAVATSPLRLYILSPRPSRLDRDARGVRRYVPGEEVGLLSSILKGLIERFREDLKKSFPDVDDVVQGEMKGEALTEELVSRLAGSKGVAFLIGTDILRSKVAVDVLKVLSNILSVLKALGRDGGFQFLFDRSNQFGAMEMGALPGILPGYRAAEEEGMDLGAMLDASLNGEMACMYIVGEDPLLTYPDGQLVREALSRVDLLIVQDAFMTETAKMADVVLPGATFAEKDGTFTSNEGRVQRVRAFYNPPFEAKVDLEIFSLVASLIGEELDPSPATVFEEIRERIPAYREANFDGLGSNGAFTTPVEGEKGGLYRVEPGKGDQDKGLAFVTGNHLYHSGYLSERSKLLKGLIEAPFAEMSREDASSFGLKEGDSLKIRSNGKAIDLKVRINGGLPEGLIFIPENFRTIGLNLLMRRGIYPFPVEIERA